MCPHESKKGIDKPVTLMLLGSGPRFPAFIGALSALEEKGIRIGKIIGASAGSIVGSLYAAGKTTLELKRMALDFDPSVIRDPSMRNLLSGKGIYEGKALEGYIDYLLEGRRFRDDFKMPLFIAATDIMDIKPFVFSRSNFADMKVSEAIRYSIGVPIVFSCRPFRQNGRRHMLIDGNLLSGAVESMFEDENEVLLVIRVATRNSIVNKPGPGFTLGTYIRNLLLILFHAVEKERVSARMWKNTILISCGDISPTRFALTKSEKNFLVEQGYSQVKKYIEYKWGL